MNTQPNSTPMTRGVDATASGHPLFAADTVVAPHSCRPAAADSLLDGTTVLYGSPIESPPPHSSPPRPIVESPHLVPRKAAASVYTAASLETELPHEPESETHVPKGQWWKRLLHPQRRILRMLEGDQVDGVGEKSLSSNESLSADPMGKHSSLSNVPLDAAGKPPHRSFRTMIHQTVLRVRRSSSGSSSAPSAPDLGLETTLPPPPPPSPPPPPLQRPNQFEPRSPLRRRQIWRRRTV
eukprot:NODE_1409_length_1545_cov_19.470588_g1270_i0.p1 GENE.NODE_1409_length_1545_cov_19.470588_g1270_i0~~NODE_1409_length_1545_cov_19.470588_g1270_i0.p1  ORF type:complete len:239 (+),score=29.05 NODE_1409_length_1545_cov_19.470588_g1270_i0:71-787(+)